MTSQPDTPYSPSHYKGKIECWEYIESLEPTGIPGVDFHRGNIIKYLHRLGRKDDTLQDASKVVVYAQRIVKLIEEIYEEDRKYNEERLELTAVEAATEKAARAIRDALKNQDPKFDDGY